MYWITFLFTIFRAHMRILNTPFSKMFWGDFTSQARFSTWGGRVQGHDMAWVKAIWVEKDRLFSISLLFLVTRYIETAIRVWIGSSLAWRFRLPPSLTWGCGRTRGLAIYWLYIPCNCRITTTYLRSYIQCQLIAHLVNKFKSPMTLSTQNALRSQLCRGLWQEEL